MRALFLLPALLLGGGWADDAPLPLSSHAPIAALACNDCSNCGFNTHLMHGSPVGDPIYVGDHPNCLQGACGGHQSCFAEQEDEQDMAMAASLGRLGEAVRQAVVTNDAAALDAAIRQDPSRVIVTSGAVQILGCDDLVVAHFPLSRQLAVAVQ